MGGLGTPTQVIANLVKQAYKNEWKPEKNR